MNENKYYLSEEDFKSIYSKVPRLTVEIIIKNENNEIYLVQRSIEPCKGKWHLPGGTVRFGEPLVESVKRIAKRELNIDVNQCKQNGYIEYPSHYLNGLDSPVGIVFEVIEYDQTPEINNEARGGEWFNKVPKNMHEDQDVYLIKHKYLS